MEPTEREIANVRRALKRLRAEPAGWEPVRSGGHTPARRWIVTMDDGRTAFAKVATDELTASWLRDEHLVYQHLQGAPFVPGYVGYFDDGEHPVLALEDLSSGTWPPPWDAAGISALLASLEAVWDTAPPPDTAVVTDDAREIAGGWDEIARAPEPFLRLGLCSERWLSANLDALRAGADRAAFGGEAFLHFDVRSDNVCFRPDDGRAVLIDWNLTAIGNPQIDVVFWLPSLQAEGGPAPETVLPDADPGLVSTCAAFFCARAARPPIPTAPTVRDVQLVQAWRALPWAARVLGLPPPA
ncbi:MAG TPA: aminoglycoside phosphotransferase family protein [Actinomycetota bacterium]|nr:aminoglycoside phosphotransferase family protein [Actinomycetota bacterium]